MKLNADGHLIVTIVDGTTLTGLFASDGSLNVFNATESSGHVGLYHPCGAYNVFVVDGTTVVGRYAANGALNVVNASLNKGIYHPSGAFNVFGDFASSGAEALLNGEDGLALDFTDDFWFASTGFYGSASIEGGGTRNGYGTSPTTTSDSLIDYTSPSVKMTMGPSGTLRYGAHNLFLNSSSPANQSVTVISGTTYSIILTGSVTTTLSGAATGTITAGTTNITAASTTLTFGSTSGTGTVQVTRTPADLTHLVTAGSTRYALPYEWNTSGELQGVLVEEARTNLCLYSQSPQTLFETAWGNNGLQTFSGGSLGNAIAAPDGTTTAAFLCEDAATAAHSLQLPVSTTSATTYTLSGFFKAGTRTRVTLYSLNADGKGLGFDLSNGSTFTPTGIPPPASSSVVAYPNGWYRCSITFTGSATTNVVGAFYITSAAEISYAGDGTSGLYFWGGQLEAGSFPTSYIQTYDSTVTRVLDNLLIDEAAFPSLLTAGTLFCEAQRPIADVTGYHLRYGTTATNYLMILDNSANLSCDVHEATAGITATFNVASANSINTPYKLALAATTNDAAAVYNGGTVQTDTSVTMPSAKIALYIGGQTTTGTVVLNGLIRKALAIPRRMSNAELQTLTTL